MSHLKVGADLGLLQAVDIMQYDILNLGNKSNCSGIYLEFFWHRSCCELAFLLGHTMVEMITVVLEADSEEHKLILLRRLPSLIALSHCLRKIRRYEKVALHAHVGWLLFAAWNEFSCVRVNEAQLILHAMPAAYGLHIHESGFKRKQSFVEVAQLLVDDSCNRLVVLLAIFLDIIPIYLCCLQNKRDGSSKWTHSI